MPFDNPINRWWTVASGAIGTALGAGVIVTRAITVVAPSISREYGWSRSFVSSWIALFMLSSGIGLVLFGNHINRYGIRRPAIVYLAIFGVLLASIGLLPPSQPLFLLAFFGLGLAGAAACGMPYVIAICALFDKKRGIALGLMSTGGIILGALLPSLAALLLTLYGWRNGLVVIAAMSSLIPILCLVLFVRMPQEVAQPAAGPISARHYTGDKVFWLLFVAIFGISVSGIGLMANLVPLLEDRGLNTTEAAWILSLSGLTAWVARPFVGWALDRLFAPYVTAVVFLIAAAGTLLIFVGGVGTPVYLGVMLVGMCLGGEADLLTYLVSRYFAFEHVSKVVGALWLAWAWGGGIGAFVAGVTFDATGSYDVAFWTYLAVTGISIVAVVALPAYRVKVGTRVQDLA